MRNTKKKVIGSAVRLESIHDKVMDESMKIAEKVMRNTYKKQTNKKKVIGSVVRREPLTK